MSIILPIVTVTVTIMTIRSLLVVMGTYKDPLLATFEIYGQPYTAKPILSLLIWLAILSYVMLFWYMHSAFVFAVGIMIVIPYGALHHPTLRLIKKYEKELCQFPHWYNDLIHMTDRHERRRIAYLWLRLPVATRMIYNVNHASFKLWVEQVLLTIA